MKIFLDDIRYPFWIYDNPDDWVVVRNFEEFKILVDKRNDIKTISFDNDLGIDDNNQIRYDGYYCLNYLIENDIYVDEIIVHSDNVVANEQIYGKANNWMKFLIKENLIDEKNIKVLKRPALHNLTEIYKKRN